MTAREKGEGGGPVGPPHPGRDDRSALGVLQFVRYRVGRWRSNLERSL